MSAPLWRFRHAAVILPRMDMEKNILIVDDDAGIRDLVSMFLESHGFQTDTAGNTDEMRRKLGQRHVDLIVLDVVMPGEDGLSALRGMQKDDGPPVIMLSAMATDIDRIVGLEMGAEDYLAKPCNPRELLARIRTVLRRRVTRAPASPAPESGLLAFAGWRIDLEARMLQDPQDRVVLLSDGEFRLLRAFVEHPRRVLTRDQLLAYTRGSDTDHYDRAIDVQISRLRRKLADSDDGQELIQTVRNEGYMFLPSVQRFWRSGDATSPIRHR
jgi:two-component system OmpR family response regulator